MNVKGEYIKVSGYAGGIRDTGEVGGSVGRTVSQKGLEAHADRSGLEAGCCRLLVVCHRPRAVHCGCVG